MMSKDEQSNIGRNIDRQNTNFPVQLFEYFKQLGNSLNEEGSSYAFLKYYQNITREYFNNIITSARGLLINYSMGLGKSIIAIAIAMDQIATGRDVIILLSKSLQSNMRAAINKYIEMRGVSEPDYFLAKMGHTERDKWIADHFQFISLNASNMFKQMTAIAVGSKISAEFDIALEKKMGKLADQLAHEATLNGKLLIIDEAHNLFRAITNGSKNAISLYEMIMRSPGLRLVFLTGTPIANDPYELAHCFNMLAGFIIFPEHYKDFQTAFISNDNHLKNKEKFQNRIFGLVSHVTHTTRPGAAVLAPEIISSSTAEFPKKLPTVVTKVEMSADQYVAYVQARDKEKDEGGWKTKAYKLRGTEGPRQAHDAPSLTKPKSGRFSSYRVRSRQISNYAPPRELMALNQAPTLDDLNGPQLESPKYKMAAEIIENHTGQLGLVYSQFVGLGGLGSFAKYLKFRGWVQYNKEARIEKFEDVIENGEVIEKTGQGDYDHSIDNYLQQLEEESTKGNWWGASETSTGGASDEDGLGTSETSTGANAVSTGGNANHEKEILAESNILKLVFPSAEEIEDFKHKYSSAEINTIKIPYGLKLGPNLVAIGEPQHLAVVTAAVENSTLIKLIFKNILNDIKAITAPVKIGANASHIHGLDANDINECWQGGNVSSNNPKNIIRRANLNWISEPNYKIGEYQVDVSVAGGARRTFAIIVGSTPQEERDRILATFTSNDNMHGGEIDLLLISATGAEGLDLKNVRYAIIMEPYWNIGRLDQVEFRINRSDSHIALPPTEKNVQTFILLAVIPKTETAEKSTDEELYEDSLQDQLLIDEFNQAIHEVSIECILNKGSCRICTPNNKSLYTDNIQRDLLAADPCKQLQESKISAEFITLANEKYYYVKSPDSPFGFKIYQFDKDLNGYIRMKENNPIFIKVIELITKK